MPPGSLEQVVFRMDCLGRHEAAGGVVINPARAIEAAVDKFLTTAKLQAAGLLTPRTDLLPNGRRSDGRRLQQLGGDVVLKPLFGSEGRGITRLNDEDLALRAFKMLAQLGAVLYLQEFIPHEGHDIRLLSSATAFSACAASTSSTGGPTSAAGPPPSLLRPMIRSIEIARRAAAAVARSAGRRRSPARQRRPPYTIEVNAVPGWKGLAKA